MKYVSSREGVTGSMATKPLTRRDCQRIHHAANGELSGERSEAALVLSFSGKNCAVRVAVSMAVTNRMPLLIRSLETNRRSYNGYNVVMVGGGRWGARGGRILSFVTALSSDYTSLRQ